MASIIFFKHFALFDTFSRILHQLLSQSFFSFILSVKHYYCNLVFLIIVGNNLIIFHSLISFMLVQIHFYFKALTKRGCKKIIMVHIELCIFTKITVFMTNVVNVQGVPKLSLYATFELKVVGQENLGILYQRNSAKCFRPR